MIDSGENNHVASCLNYGIVVMGERERHASQNMQLSVLQMWCFASVIGPRVTGMWSKLALLEA